MNTLKNYAFFNHQYKGLSKNQLMFQYQKDKKNPLIICSFEEFKEKYPHFDIEFYKNAYQDLKNKNNKELIHHWVHFGIFNNYISLISRYNQLYNEYTICNNTTETLTDQLNDCKENPIDIDEGGFYLNIYNNHVLRRCFYPMKLYNICFQ